MFLFKVLDMLAIIASSAFSTMLDGLLDVIPSLEISVIEIPTIITQIVNFLYYILPMNDIFAIFSITVFITCLRIAIAIIKFLLNIVQVIT